MTLIVSSIVCGVLVFAGCNHVVEDGSYILRGTVVDSVSGTGLSEVVIGYRLARISDSSAFPGDTVNFQSLEHWVLSYSNGAFELMEFPGGRDVNRYERLVAWKAGYALWRYSRKPLAIVQRNESEDTIRIQLTPLP
jgi:hypothetical protein